MLSGLVRRESDALAFTAEMQAVQLDQLAVVLGIGAERASGVVSRWRNLGLAKSARLGPGPPWVWVTRTGLAACGLSYPAGPPAPSRLAHTRAVTAVRLTLQATTAYRRARATWRGERGIRASRQGGFRGSVPDGELHWPRGAAVSWAGQCWAVQAAVARTAVGDTAAVMRELLTRAGDGPCPPAVRPPGLGRPERYARVLYLCSPAALPAVVQARDALGRAGARIEIRDLPPGAVLALAPGRPALPLAPGRAAPPFAPGRAALPRAPGHPAPQPPGVSSVRR
jgi:hypothetical protein